MNKAGDHILRTFAIYPLKEGLLQFSQLIKLNLTLVVTFTSIGSYVLSSALTFSWIDLLILGFGGFFVTSAANIINEVLERDYDKHMTRTKERPLVVGSLSVSNAVLLSGIFCLVGITLLSKFNVLTPFFAMVGYVLYAFLYTPLKRISPWAVFVGAISGALPMIIGSTAFFGEITYLAILLFGIQFFWQFPHFWAIGFKAYSDYKKAGFRFIPGSSDQHPSKWIGLNSVWMTILIFPCIALLYTLNIIGLITALSLGLLTMVFLYASINFCRAFNQQSATKLLIYSILYIPLLLIIMIVGI